MHQCSAAKTALTFTTSAILTTMSRHTVAATAFLFGHNKDRLGITMAQIHKASITSGDPEALAVETVCKAAGVELLVMPPPVYAPRQTTALGTIRSGRSVRHRTAAAPTAAAATRAEGNAAGVVQSLCA